MSDRLRALIADVLPAATRWAEACEAEVLRTGAPLDASQLALARAVGVREPGRVRVQIAGRMPLPDDPALRQAAQKLGMLGPSTIGLTLGRAIFVREGRLGPRLVAHECRHVHQYERAGSIAAFLAAYLEQIAAYGYYDAPFEVDARAHEGG